MQMHEMPGPTHLIPKKCTTTIEKCIRVENDLTGEREQWKRSSGLWATETSWTSYIVDLVHAQALNDKNRVTTSSGRNRHRGRILGGRRVVPMRFTVRGTRDESFHIRGNVLCTRTCRIPRRRANEIASGTRAPPQQRHDEASRDERIAADVSDSQSSGARAQHIIMWR